LLSAGGIAGLGAIRGLAPRRAVYRAGQFARGLRGALTTQEITEVRRLLSRDELALFVAMERRDRRHSMDVLLALRARAASRGVVPGHELEAAALLHDVGKGDLLVWDRVAYVLLGRVSTRLLDRVANARGGARRRAAWRLHYHARLGADHLREAGSHPRIIDLVVRHTDRPVESDDAELAWLVAADEIS
jgi:hypothetical protein